MNYSRTVLPVFVLLSGYLAAQTGLNLTSSFSAGKGNNLNLYGHNFALDIDKSKKSRLVLNTGLVFTYLEGHKKYSVDSSYIEMRPNGSGQRPYNRTGKILQGFCHTNVKLRLLKKKKSNLFVTAGGGLIYTVVNLYYGENYKAPFGNDSTFYPGPFNYKAHSRSKIEMFFPSGLSANFSVDYTLKVHKYKHLLFRINLMNYVFSKESYILSFSFGIRLL
jgi:hypothetical protein